jgi:hypothetical protein
MTAPFGSQINDSDIDRGSASRNEKAAELPGALVSIAGLGKPAGESGFCRLSGEGGAV